jgi:CheY-like chemotaxis protein
MFGMFEQGSTGDRKKFGGVGIGLTIVQKLVEMQGGKLIVDSLPGRGSEFRFSLPFLFPQNDVAGADMRALQINTQQPARVLIVDDNPINQMLISTVLDKRGYVCEVADNGQAAVDKVNLSQFDLILMDLQMPVMDGYEATRSIRMRNDIKRTIPIIAITAHSVSGAHEKCEEAGMNGYVTKPFDPEDLDRRIRSLIARAHMLAADQIK